MVMGTSPEVWENVLQVTSVCEEQKNPPLLWGVEVCKCLQEGGVMTPSVELGQILVSHLCWSNNGPTLWKYLEQAMASHLVPSMPVLALLTTRVVSNRQHQPEAYRLYLELLSNYAFTFTSTKVKSCREKSVKAVDDALQLSQSFEMPITELGEAAVQFVFTVVSRLVDAIIEDQCLQVSWSEKRDKWTGSTGTQNTEMDLEEVIDDKRHEHREHLRRTNTMKAFEVVGKIMEHKITSTLLCLARRNMPKQWGGFIQHLQMLEVQSSSPNSKVGTELIMQLRGCIQRGLSREYKPNQHQAIRALFDTGSRTSSFGCNYGVSRAAVWLPFDMFMENAMEGKQLPATSAIEVLAELTKSLQAVNGTSWQETFLGLWTAALRLVQRERDPLEGPIPHLDSRLCILLSITPLAVAYIVEEEERELQTKGNMASENIANTNEHDKERKVAGEKRAAMASSLQILGEFDGLLAPPQSVVSIANQAAARAAIFVSNLNGGNESFDGLGTNDNSSKAAGNMRHLIVEACVARRLLDTSAYFWPGYVGRPVNPMSMPTLAQISPWSAFMKGAEFSTPLINALKATPASSLAELEKMYEVAINGPEEERAVAASILCGASLISGWNIQEHTVCLVTRLLLPPIPADYQGPESHLVAYGPMLYSVLIGISPVDTVHVLSLYGKLPELAAALMPICEVFGSTLPAGTWTSSGGEKISVYMVFSYAFLLLLKLWKFYRPPHECCLLGRGAPLGSQLTLEYLLLLRNSLVASPINMSVDQTSKDAKHYRDKRFPCSGSSFPQASIPVKGHTLGPSLSSIQPVFIESFPKLKAWYCQHQACIASTISGLAHGDAVRQTADKLLNMMLMKMSKGGTASSATGTSASSNLSSSSGDGGEDGSERPVLPAWEILGAVPFVVDAMLTACAHGRLSPRNLTTGLRDLVHYLPASLATIVSYFSAEVTRGTWKPALMNGTDWPSPAANLLSLESEIKEILAATDVHVPGIFTGGDAPASLSLPLAALVSLTITFKLEKPSNIVLSIAGPALESVAAGSPWPSMPIVAALWAQKVRKWHDYIAFYASRTVFQQNKHAVVQLLRSCFTVALGSRNTLMSKLSVHGGVGALLGHGFSSHSAPGGPSPVGPGILYLRTYRAILDIMFVTEEILSLVVAAARDLTASGADAEYSGQISRSAYRFNSHQLSLATALAKAKQASALGASLLCISGGLGLVQMLYKETLPTWFLSRNGSKHTFFSVLEGYAIAYFAILSGAFTWGINTSSLSRRRGQIVGYHMEFLASALNGKFSLGCGQATWKAYVSSFVSMVITCAPNWISEIKLDTLKKLSTGLRWWHEPELAFALLERGGITAMSAAAEFVMEY